MRKTRRLIDFPYVAEAAARAAPQILARWLPDGRREGHEFVARNPKRADAHAGSFKVNLRSGAWSDFATGVRGGDLVSLAAYLFGGNMREAAENVAKMIGIDPYVR